MKRFITFTALCALISAAPSAEVKISQLPVVTTVASTAAVPVVQGGVTSQAATSNLWTLTQTGTGANVISKSGNALTGVSLGGGTNISLSTAAGTLIINATGSASGEANTASNLGAGSGIFAQKSGVDLQFKSLVASTGITLSTSATAITLSSTGAGHETQRLSLASGQALVMASGPAASLASVAVVVDTAVAATTQFTITVPANVVIQSIKVFRTAAQTSGRTALRVILPDPHGATTVETAIRPLAARLTTSNGAIASFLGTTSMSGSNVIIETVSHGDGLDQAMQVNF